MTTLVATPDERAAQAAQVIERVAAGALMASACEEVGITPGAFVHCLSRLRNLAELYAHAQSVRADILADETLTIADTDKDASRARNRILARQWRASKLAPKTYGERLDIAVTQSISVSDALTEARSRLLRPVRDQPSEKLAQDVEFVEVSAPRSSDEASRSADEPDIFS